MLTVVIPASESFNEETQEFISTKEQTLQLEHSLVSLSKWESKWRKPFLGKDPKTTEEIIDYIRCMTITQNVDPKIYSAGVIPMRILNQINDYIEAPMTATWFNEHGNPPKKSSKAVTAELIYYWMIALNIPFECQKWHLNKLMTLIRVCTAENAPKEKVRRSDILAKNRRLNAARRAKAHSRG